MFTRRFKQAFARICIALLCLQATIAAYACPAFLAEIQSAPAVATAHHGDHEVASIGDCEQRPADVPAGKSMCHEQFAGDQSVGTGTLVSASVPPMAPLVMAAIEPAKNATAVVLPVLLQRSTAPPVSIRFQVFRI